MMVHNSEKICIPFSLRTAIFFSVLVIAIIYFRRPDQFLNPAVWCEDASVIIHKYIEHGWLSFFGAEQGYMMISSRILNFAALGISFLYYPELASAFATLFMLATGFAVWLSPTQLKGKFLCALAMFLIPTNPETFAVALYSFWWAGILVILALVWNYYGASKLWQIAFLLLGGLSSPTIIPLAPAFLVRAAIIRKSHEYVIAGLATTLAILQFAVMFSRSKESGEFPDFGISLILQIIHRYFGNFALPNFESAALIIGIGIALVLLTYCFFMWRNLSDRHYYLLGYVMCVAIFLSTYRTGGFDIHPVDLGPRYFFYPYILLSWLIIHLACRTLSGKVILAFCAASIAVNVGDGFTRVHEKFDWRGQIQSAMAFDRSTLFAHFDGWKFHPIYSPKVTRDELIRLQNQSLLDQFLNIGIVAEKGTPGYHLIRLEHLLGSKDIEIKKSILPVLINDTASRSESQDIQATPAKHYLEKDLPFVVFETELETENKVILKSQHGSQFVILYQNSAKNGEVKARIRDLEHGEQIEFPLQRTDKYWLAAEVNAEGPCVIEISGSVTGPGQFRFVAISP